MSNEMKLYKGFDKDLKCRDFQFEIGGEYEESEADLCNKGFHACESPLDTFVYYAPANSRYCKVVLDDVSPQTDSDTKRVGRKIKIGAEIGIPGLIKAQFEWVKSQIADEKVEAGGYMSALTGGDMSALTGGYMSALTGGYMSALTGGNRSALTGGNRSALTGGNRSALTGGDESALTGGYMSALTGGDMSALTGGDESALTGGNRSALTGGDESALTGGNRSALTGGNRSALTGGNMSALTGGNRSALTGGNRSALTGGYMSALTGGRGSKHKAGMWSTFSEPKYCEEETWKIIGVYTAVVDGEKIKPDTWYKVVDGEFIEVDDEI